MPYKIELLELAENDYLYWKRHNPKIADRIDELFEDIQRDPFNGIGKPKRLKWEQGSWSRRITTEHRIVYKVKGDLVIVYRCYGHYE